MKQPTRGATPMLALMLIVAGGNAGARQNLPLGRLFSEPAERAALDARRANGGQAAAPVPAPAVADAPAAAAPAPAEPVVLNGIVRRSGGKSTVWLNQVPQNDGNNTFTGQQALSLQTSAGRTVVLKPGQRFNPDDGSVGEDHGR